MRYILFAIALAIFFYPIQGNFYLPRCPAFIGYLTPRHVAQLPLKSQYTQVYTKGISLSMLAYAILYPQLFPFHNGSYHIQKCALSKKLMCKLFCALREPRPASEVSQVASSREDTTMHVNQDLIIGRDIIFEAGASDADVDSRGGIRGRFADIARVNSEDIDIAAGDAPVNQFGGIIFSEDSFGINICSCNGHIESIGSKGYNYAADLAKAKSVNSSSINMASFGAHAESNLSDSFNVAIGDNARALSDRAAGLNFAANSALAEEVNSNSFNFASFNAWAQSERSTGFTFSAGNNARVRSEASAGFHYAEEEASVFSQNASGFNYAAPFADIETDRCVSFNYARSSTRIQTTQAANAFNFAVTGNRQQDAIFINDGNSNIINRLFNVATGVGSQIVIDDASAGITSGVCIANNTSHIINPGTGIYLATDGGRFQDGPINGINLHAGDNQIRAFSDLNLQRNVLDNSVLGALDANTATASSGTVFYIDVPITQDVSRNHLIVVKAQTAARNASLSLEGVDDNGNNTTGLFDAVVTDTSSAGSVTQSTSSQTFDLHAQPLDDTSSSNMFYVFYIWLLSIDGGLTSVRWNGMSRQAGLLTHIDGAAISGTTQDMTNLRIRNDSGGSLMAYVYAYDVT